MTRNDSMCHGLQLPSWRPQPALSAAPRPAAAGLAIGSCSGGHRRLLRKCPRRTPTVRTPTVRTPTAVPEAAAGQPRRRRCPVPQPPRTPRPVSGCPAGCGRTAADPQPPLRRDGSAAQVALARLRWSTRPGRRSRGGTGCPDRRTPDTDCRTPGARMPRHCGHTRDRGRAMRTLRQRPRWTAGSRTVHHRSHLRPERDRNAQPAVQHTEAAAQFVPPAGLCWATGQVGLAAHLDHLSAEAWRPVSERKALQSARGPRPR